MVQSVTQNLSGWGGFPVEECSVYRPEKRRIVGTILDSKDQPNFIARGMGRSYGDTATNGRGGVIAMPRLNRLLDFTPSTGVLHCEAGVTLEEIIDTFLPRGFFLPVTPGTKFVTVGGAIANDVHGKNHHRDGTFGQFVLEIELLTPSGEILICTPESNADVLWATIGGIGLTGVILTARFKLQPVETAYILSDYKRTKDLDGLLAALDESEDAYQYSVAWIDCLARGRNVGRSVLMLGKHATKEDLTPAIRDPFTIRKGIQKTIPFNLPSFALNPFTITVFNSVYYAVHPTADRKLVDYETYFYPLDSVHNFNRMYGKQGLIQYQVTFPLESIKGLVELIERLSKSSCASFLAVLKKMGPANQGLLSHPFEGYTLCLDIPVRPGLVEFIHELDKHLLDYGGRLYLAKDAIMTAATFEAMYPARDAFMEIRNRLDPDHRLSSDMARRLGLARREAA